MKANELRIGNLFRDKYNTKNHFKVCGLSENITFDYITFNNWQAEPIPLTEEWLLKFGFDEEIKDYLGFYRFKKGKFVVVREQNVYGYPYEDYEGNEFDLELEHIHQLQNLYHALTGEEL